jgi:hypothetical protein
MSKERLEKFLTRLKLINNGYQKEIVSVHKMIDKLCMLSARAVIEEAKAACVRVSYYLQEESGEYCEGVRDACNLMVSILSGEEDPCVPEEHKGPS